MNTCEKLSYFIDFIMILIVLLLIQLCITSCSFSNSNTASTSSSILGYLQQESFSLTSIQQKLIDELRYKHKISIGYEGSGAIRQALEHSKQQQQAKIIMSEEGKEVDCRISLGKVPIGRKAVAPCQCTGSQRWIQYSTYNKLRRKDPSQWKTCKTCQAPYMTISSSSPSSSSPSSSDHKVMLSMLSSILDDRKMLRMLIGASMMMVGYMIQAPRLLLKMIVSTAFWNKYPSWSRLLHLPLVLKLWFGRMGLSYIWSQYLVLESSLVQYLADIETAWIEPTLIPNA